MTSKSNQTIFWITLSLTLFLTCRGESKNSGQQIDRQVLVRRHIIKNEKFDSLSSLSVGNGSFAFTVDATGLQTFPALYEKGVSLGTQSEWGWHSFPDTNNFRYEEILKEYDFHGRKITYNYQWSEPERQRMASDYLRQNPHRLHLGLIGLEIFDKKGEKVLPGQITQIQQELDMWSGKIHSVFKIDNQTVEVITFCHQDMDLISAEIKSPLVREGRIKICLRFPYPSGKHVGSGCNWSKPDKHRSYLTNISENSAQIIRNIDSAKYYTNLKFDKKSIIEESSSHYFIISPGQKNNVFTFSCYFSQNDSNIHIPGFEDTKKNNQNKWKEFWNSGGAVDFFGSTDPRAFELERRIVLSQYLMKIQCAGNYPPQETGLTFNSWFGKFHLEMHWWHAVHFALWNRIDLLEKSLGYYKSIAGNAQDIAKRQEFDGLRWPKMTDLSGIDSPSGVGSFLIWQQPHFIYFAELCFRHHKNLATLEKYADLVFKTADFMASYAQYDNKDDRFILGPVLIPAQECFPASKTINPPFELAYWYWGLSTAQEWRERMELPRNPKWDSVLFRLSPLAVSNNLYLFAESAPDSYTEKYTRDHPMVLGAMGILPQSHLIDTAIMHSTFNWIWENWQWQNTWGWDFPMTAMTATRLGLPEKAIDALFMDITTNTYLANGHNYQDDRLRIYLPGNGGLLTAIAMMCAGYDGCEIENPGIPKNGKWKLRWENLAQMP